MIQLSVRFVALLATGLTAGITLCVFFLERSFSGNATQYVEYKQLLIRALTVSVPVLGMIGLLAAAGDTYLRWRQGPSLPFQLTAAAVLLNLIALLVTRVVHFPINDQIMSWNPAAAPETWSAVRERWASVHMVRTAVSVASFATLALAALVRAPSA